MYPDTHKEIGGLTYGIKVAGNGKRRGGGGVGVGKARIRQGRVKFLTLIYN